MGLKEKIPPTLVSGCVILILNLILSFSVRTQIVNDLQNKYTLSSDAYRYLRQAKLIEQYGKLPERDLDRWVPLGVNLTKRTTLFPKLIAYSHRVYKLFDPSIMLETIAIYYPAVIYLLSLILSYFLLSRSFGKSTALLSTTIVAIIPVLIRPTIAGETDRDSLSLLLGLLIFYVYYQSTQLHRGKLRLGLSVLSGVISAITGLVWEGAGLFMLVIVVYNMALLVLEGFTQKNFEHYCAWYFPMCLTLLVSTGVYHVVSVYSVLLIGFPSFFFILAGTYMVINRFGNEQTLSKIPLGFLLSFLSTVLFLVGSVFSSHVFRITRMLFSPIGGNKVLRYVAELQPTSPVDWLTDYGIFLAFACGGGIILMYRIAERLKLDTWLCAAGLQFFLTSLFFTRLIPAGRLNFLYGALYTVASLVFLVLTLGQYLYLKKYIDLKGELDPWIRRNLFFLSWLVVMLVSASTAVRFNLFLAFILVALGSYAIVELLRFLVQDRNCEVYIICMVFIILCWEIFALYPLLGFSQFSSKVAFGVALSISLALTIPMIILMKQKIKRNPRIVLVGVIVLICPLLPHGQSGLVWGYADKAYQMASQLKPGLRGPWLRTIQWIEKNTPKDAVIGAWWDYGSLINHLTKRKTIIDEEQLQYWIRLFARHVLLGKTEVEALEFLKTHEVTHLLISPREIFNITGISQLASKENLDRAGEIVPLQLQESNTKSNMAILSYSANVKIPDAVELDGHIYSKQQLLLKEVSFKIKQGENGEFSPLEIKGLISVGGQEMQVMFDNVYFGNELIATKDSIKIPGTLFIIPDSTPSLNGNWDAIYCSQSTAESWAVKSYLLNQSSDSVKLLNSAKLSGPDDSPGLWGIKIWSLKYPHEIQINPKYLQTEMEKFTE